MKYEMMVSDFDGTLGRISEINAETVEAIKEFERKGGKFVICTGRMYCSIERICLKYGFKGALIAYQGALIKDVESGKEIFSGGIKKDLLIKVVDEFVEDGLQAVIFKDDKLYYDKESWYIDFYRLSPDAEIIKVPSITEFLENADSDLLKCTAVGNKESVGALTKKYNEKYKGKLIFNNGNETLMEVINPECSKGESVKRAAAYYGVPLEKVITVGDSTNDIELLKGPWRGVAVGNASEELKKVADEITVPFEENPVLALLKKYCL